MIDIGELKFEVSEPHPCWIHIVQGDNKISITHHKIGLVIDVLEHLKKEAHNMLPEKYKGEIEIS